MSWKLRAIMYCDKTFFNNNNINNNNNNAGYRVVNQLIPLLQTLNSFITWYINFCKMRITGQCDSNISIGSECWAVTERDVLKIDALDQWCLLKLLGMGTTVCGMMPWDGQPGNPACQLLSKHSFLAVWPHCANARRNRCQEDLNSWPLENWRRPPGCPCTMWMKTIQQYLKSTTSPWMKQSTWLRIIHCGDWCLRLALCTPRGARHERRISVIVMIMMIRWAWRCQLRGRQSVQDAGPVSTCPLDVADIQTSSDYSEVARSVQTAHHRTSQRSLAVAVSSQTTGHRSTERLSVMPGWHLEAFQSRVSVTARSVHLLDASWYHRQCLAVVLPAPCTSLLAVMSSLDLVPCETWSDAHTALTLNRLSFSPPLTTQPISTQIWVNPLTPTVAIWVQL